MPGRRLVRRCRAPWLIWLSWLLAVAVIATCPALLSDPGMWAYLLDPELLALVIVVGFQLARLELGVVLLRVKLSLRRGTTRPMREP